MSNGIFHSQLLQFGPWQEFERNTARLLLHAGWTEPRIVGRAGDGGADVLAVKNGKLWLFQCKHSSRSGPSRDAIDQVRNAGKLYSADALCVVSSQRAGAVFTREINRLQSSGLEIRHLGPDDLLALAESVSHYPPSRVRLREYQNEALEAVRSALLETGKAQLVLATGLGKTVVMGELVADMMSDGLLPTNRVLVVAHTNPLVNQLLLSFWRHLPKSIETHRLAAGERPTRSTGITFATIQTLMNHHDPDPYDLVIIDEAHHLGAPDYIRTIERIDSTMLAGVTATPWRTDKVAISHWLGAPVYSMGIKEGLAQGFLAEVEYRIFTDGIDWSLVSEASKYGYSIAQLNKYLMIPTRDEEAIRQIQKAVLEEEVHRGIVFSPSQMHARSFASDLRRHGFSAASLTSDDDTITRYRVLSQFAAGQIQFIAVVDIFNEGMDVPDVDLLVFMRVTHSRRIFVQQLGRGLRISESKRRVLVLDFAADIRRVHAAIDLATPDGQSEIERLLLSHAHVSFSDRSIGKFFYEWIADIGNLQDADEDAVIRLPILDPHKLNYPDPEEF